MLIIINAQLVDEVYQFYQVHTLQVFGEDIIGVFFADDLFKKKVQLAGFFPVKREKATAVAKGRQPAKAVPQFFAQECFVETIQVLFMPDHTMFVTGHYFHHTKPGTSKESCSFVF